MEMNNRNSTLCQNQTQEQQNVGLKRLSELLPIAIAITITNGLVFVMFYRRKSLRTASNYLLLGLAVCDFLTGTINIPYFIMFSFVVTSRNSLFSYWLYVLHSLMAISVAYHILMITADKYLAIIRPLKHHLVNKKTVLRVLVGIWITAGSIAVIPFAWRESQSPSVWYIVHAAVCLIIVFLVPYVLMLYAYIVMFKVVTKRSRPSSVHRLAKKNINDRKCVVVFAAMAAIFACCWLPYFTLTLITLIMHTSNYTRNKDTFASIQKTIKAFLIIRYMTSVVNPLLYTFFKRDFWFALRNISVKGEVRLPPKRFETRLWSSCPVVSQASSVDSKTRLSSYPCNKEGRSTRVELCIKTDSGGQILYISSV